MRLKEKIKDKQEDVIEEVGEHKQTIHEQEKVQKEPKSVLSVKKVKRKRRMQEEEDLKMYQPLQLQRLKEVEVGSCTNFKM